MTVAASSEEEVFFNCCWAASPPRPRTRSDERKSATVDEEEWTSAIAAAGSSGSSCLLIQLRKLLASVEELEGEGFAEAKPDRERTTRAMAAARRRLRRWLGERSIALLQPSKVHNLFSLPLRRAEKDRAEKHGRVRGRDKEEARMREGFFSEVEPKKKSAQL